MRLFPIGGACVLLSAYPSARLRLIAAPVAECIAHATLLFVSILKGHRATPKMVSTALSGSLRFPGEARRAAQGAFSAHARAGPGCGRMHVLS